MIIGKIPPNLPLAKGGIHPSLEKRGEGRFSRQMYSQNLWPDTTSEARDLQEILRKSVRIIPLRGRPGNIAAVDASFLEERVIAVASLFSYPGLEHVQDAYSVEKTGFPYIPGLLTFREGKAVVNAIKKLEVPPEVILVDGQGIAHPKGIGIASHIGVILGKATIGCAKSRLVGEFEEPGRRKGKWSYLFYEGRKVGAVLRTRSEVRPLFVSPGHLTDITSSVEVVMKCISRYRIPEPLRRADIVSKRLKKDLMEKGEKRKLDRYV